MCVYENVLFIHFQISLIFHLASRGLEKRSTFQSRLYALGGGGNGRLVKLDSFWFMFILLRGKKVKFYLNYKKPHGTNDSAES